MSSHPNFLLGYGERLVEKVAVSAAGGPKKMPYTLAQARTRLAPRVQAAARALQDLPENACPQDEAVALITLHPAFIAKTYYPFAFLRAAGLAAVGSRPRRDLTPEATTRKKPPPMVETTELFIAGPRDSFRALAVDVPGVSASDPMASDLVKIEDFRVPTAAERVRPFVSDTPKPLLEVVLHATEQHEYVLQGFEAFLGGLDLRADMDRRFYVGGLCFLPLKAPRELVPKIAEFSFLRVAREMPRLRQFQPVLRAFPKLKPVAPVLPQGPPLDGALRVAVFDGGAPADWDLAPWVTPHPTQGIGAEVVEGIDHGTAVSSAVLFGSLDDAKPAPRPYSYVDHFRVIDANTAQDDQAELYTVLARIRDVLQRKRYAFVNLSVGPDIPVEDDDVHAWTAVLDELLSDGSTFASIAAGNAGERDHASGNARIQTPADCVNAVSVGAASSITPHWRRAPYSSVGPGRRPGVVKPDVLAFGGTRDEPFWVMGPARSGLARPTGGTSFAAPTTLRAAVAVRAHLGDVLKPLALKALLIHHAEPEEHPRNEIGWGRIPNDVEDLVICDDSTVVVVYQGELFPRQWVRVPIPVPAGSLQGTATIAATFTFATPVDPEDPINYTRSGLEVRFRPNQDRFSRADQDHADTEPFFQAREYYLHEDELRFDAHKWETALHRSKRIRGHRLNGPVFDVHYNARERGHDSITAGRIPYALVVSVHAPHHPRLYDQVLQRYRTQLEPLRPVIQIPVRV